MDDVSTTFWQFVRGDLPVADFEVWLYGRQDLEQRLGEELYIELISLDFQNRRDLFVLRKKLDAFLRTALKCECVALPDMAVVPMGGDGLDDKVFSSLEEVRSHGEPAWWLFLSRCNACQQNWMVAADERIYDDYFMRRLGHTEAQEILIANCWPSDFITYERVLGVGRKLSSPPRFFDDLAKSLVWTAQDLRKDRPEISVQEIADLLGVSPEHAARLLTA